jgi:hypothetical protein
MLEVPEETPVTTPVEIPMVAFDGVLLVHVPPIDVFVSVIVWPTHTTESPDISAIAGLTDTVVVL